MPLHGFNTSYKNSRLNHLVNTSYPAAIAQAYLAVYLGALPAADGTGGTEAVATRPSVTLGSPATDFNGRQYITNTASVTFTAGSTGGVIGFGICSANSGGSAIYADLLYPFQVVSGQSYTIPANAINVYSEIVGV